MCLDIHYKDLVNCLRFVASDHETQIKSLPEYADVTEEVFSTLENNLMHMPQMIENDMLSQESIAGFLRCYNWMSILLSNEEAMTLEGFANHEYWSELRTMGLQVLKAMNEEMTIPEKI